MARQTSTVLARDVCDGAAVAEVGCTECQKRFCSRCRQVHDQVAGTSSHSLMSLACDIVMDRASAKSKSSRGGSSRRNTCKVHGQEVVLFCNHCDATLCRQCQKTSHRGHVVEELTIVMEKLRTEVRSLLQDIQKQVKKAEEEIQQSNTEEQELERQKQDEVGQVVEAAGKVTAWAHQAEDKVVAQINDVSAPIRTRLLTQKKTALERKTALDQLRNRARHAMQNGSFGELQSLKRQMEETLSTQALSSPLKPEGSGPKQTEFFRRQSSGQELLQNAVPKFVGEVTPFRSGQPNTQVENRQNAWGLVRERTDLNYSISLHMTAQGLQLLQSRGQWHPHQMYRTESYVIQDSLVSVLCSIDNDTFDGNYDEIEGATSFPSTEVLVLERNTLYIGNDYQNLVRATLCGPSPSFSSALLSRDSMPNGRHAYLLDTKTPDVCEIQELILTPPATVTVQPVFQVVHESAPLAFDVSSDAKYFAILSDHCYNCTVADYYCSVDVVRVSVFRRMQAEPCAIFCSPKPEGSRDTVSGDLCFSKYHGKEVLRVSVHEDNTVYVLDYENDCAVVGRTLIT